jgi:hypothetical protein
MPNKASGLVTSVKLTVECDGHVRLSICVVLASAQEHTIPPPATGAEHTRLHSARGIARAKADDALQLACFSNDLAALRAVISTQAASAGVESRALLYARETAKRLERQQKQHRQAEAKKDRLKEVAQSKSKSDDVQHASVAWLKVISPAQIDTTVTALVSSPLALALPT